MSADENSPQQSELTFQGRSAADLCSAAADGRLNEDLALALLAVRDLPAEAIEAIAKHRNVAGSRRVLRALVEHPHCPRHIALPRVRHLYTFELMQIALAPAAAGELKVVAEEAIIRRLDATTMGERLTLARRASTRVAAALLCDRDPRVMETALQNSRLTETWVVRTLQRKDCPEPLVAAVSRHPRWASRRDVQMALLRHPLTPLAQTSALAAGLPIAVLRDVLEDESARPEVREIVAEELRRRNAQ
jgi:hypothetical protein